MDWLPPFEFGNSPKPRQGRGRRSVSYAHIVVTNSTSTVQRPTFNVQQRTWNNLYPLDVDNCTRSWLLQTPPAPGTTRVDACPSAGAAPCTSSAPTAATPWS